jgi:magnesium-transporting ATPase (P-type)
MKHTRHNTINTYTLTHWECHGLASIQRIVSETPKHVNTSATHFTRRIKYNVLGIVVVAVFAGFFFFHVSHAFAATLYFNGVVNNNWNTLDIF